jgi:hypothetical protein
MQMEETWNDQVGFGAMICGTKRLYALTAYRNNKAMYKVMI